MFPAFPTSLKNTFICFQAAIEGGEEGGAGKVNYRGSSPSLQSSSLRSPSKLPKYSKLSNM